MEFNQCKARFSLIGQAGSRPRIEFQAKASSRELLQEHHLALPLSIKNYNDLRADVIVPRLLIVVLMPEQPEDWLHHSEDQLCLRHCGYWLSLAGQPDTENTATVTVHLPRQQRFDSERLSKSCSIKIKALLMWEPTCGRLGRSSPASRLPPSTS